MQRPEQNQSDLIYSTEVENNPSVLNVAPQTRILNAALADSIIHIPSAQKSINAPPQSGVPEIQDFSFIENLEPNQQDDSYRWEDFSRNGPFTPKSPVSNSRGSRGSSNFVNLPVTFRQNSDSVTMSFEENQQKPQKKCTRCQALYKRVKDLEAQSLQLAHKLQKAEERGDLGRSRNQSRKKIEEQRQRQVTYEKDQNMIQSCNQREVLDLTENLSSKEMMELVRDTKSMLLLEEAIKFKETEEQIRSETDKIQGILREALEQRLQVIQAMEVQKKKHRQSLAAVKLNFQNYRERAEKIIRQYQNKVDQLQVDIKKTIEENLRISIKQSLERSPVRDQNFKNSTDEEELRRVLQIELRQLDQIDGSPAGRQQKYRVLKLIFSRKIPQYVTLLYSLSSTDAEISCSSILDYFKESNPRLHDRIDLLLEASLSVKGMQSVFKGSGLFNDIAYSRARQSSSQLSQEEEEVQARKCIKALKYNLESLVSLINKNESVVGQKLKSNPQMFVSTTYFTLSKIVHENLREFSKQMRSKPKLQQHVAAALKCVNENLAITHNAIYGLLIDHECTSKTVAEQIKDNEDHVRQLLRVYFLVFGIVKNLNR